MFFNATSGMSVSMLVYRKLVFSDESFTPLQQFFLIFLFYFIFGSHTFLHFH